MVRYHEDISSPKSEIHVHHFGGAVARVPADATAFGDRSAPFLLNMIASTFTGRWLRRGRAVGARLHEALAPSLTGGTYVNFLTDEGEDGCAPPTARTSSSGWWRSRTNTTPPTCSG